MGDLQTGTSALVWALTAMGDATERLLGVRAWDRPRAFVVIGEAVWWVTMVDATLVRHHPHAYDAVIAGHSPAGRDAIEGTLAGLRFVRNQIGGGTDVADFLEPSVGGPESAEGRIALWVWKPVPEPSLPPGALRGRVWETMRYRAYQAHLAGRSVGETFGRAAGFVQLAAANAPAITGWQEHVAGMRGK